MKVTGHVERRANGLFWLIAESMGRFPWRRVAKLSDASSWEEAQVALSTFLDEKRRDKLACNARRER